MYEKFQKNKKILALMYIGLLVFGFFFVRKALNTESISIETKSEKSVDEIKPVKVALAVEDLYGNSINYSARLKNDDSVLDLLEYLRDNDNFWFEKIAYTYGFEIENVNRNRLSDDMRWGVFSSESKEDISYEIDKYKLTDGDSFLLRPITIHNEVQQ